MLQTNIIDKGMTTFQGAPIRVTVAASVAFNPDALKKSISGLMEKLGCGKCFSGFDCHFQLQRDFLIDPELKTSAFDYAIDSRLPEVNVAIDNAKSFSIDLVKSIIDKLHGKFGCLPCHSGFDVRFKHIEREMNLSKLEI